MFLWKFWSGEKCYYSNLKNNINWAQAGFEKHQRQEVCRTLKIPRQA